MALMHSTPGGSTYPDAETLEAEPDDISEAMRAHALSEDARHREMVDGFREGLEHVNLRVDDVEAVMGGLSTLAGVNPGSPTDAAVTALIGNTGTTTRQALDARYATTAALDALAESLDDLGPVHISHFGAVGDGVVDDTAALKVAAGSGREVHFDPNGAYSFVGPLTLSPGARWVMMGATLYCASPRDAPNITIDSRVHIDRLDVSFAGGDNDRGVLIRGDDVQVGHVRVTARQPAATRNHRRRGLTIGVEGVGCSGVRLGRVEVEGWLYSVGAWQAKDVTIDGLMMTGHIQGLLVRDPIRVRVRSGMASLPSTSMLTGGPGENAVLIENTNADYEGGDISIEHFTSYGAGEHSFRVGGQVPITRVTFEHCTSVRSGAGGGTGGCGFKVLGPTETTSNAVKHTEVRFIDCIVDGVDSKAPATKNVAAFNVGKSSKVTLDNITVKHSGASGQAAPYGVAMIGVKDVAILNPSIEDATVCGIHVYDSAETSTVTWGGDPESISIVGGEISRCKRGVDVDINGRTIRRFSVTGTTIDSGDYNIRTANAALNRCTVDFKGFSATTATLLGCEGMMVRGMGDLVGDSVAKAGSTWVVYTGGFKRYSSGWSTL